MFENCTVELGIDKYDEVKINETNFKCRLCKTDEKLACFMEQSENKFAGVVSRITKLEEEERKNEIEARRKGVDEWMNRMNEIATAAEGRLSAIDKRVSELEMTVGVVNERGDKVEVYQEVSDVRLTELGVNVSEIDDRLKRIDSLQVSVSENLMEIGEQQNKLEELGSAVKIQMNTFVEEWPKLGEEGDWQFMKGKKATRLEKMNRTTRVEGKSHQSAPVGENDISQLSKKSEDNKELSMPGVQRVFSDQCRDVKDGTFLVIGDSMAREVGKHLNKDNVMFEKLDFGGAKIEDLTEMIRTIGERPENHAIVMIGTNNLVHDETEAIMRKYGELIAKMKENKYKDISVVGILKRANLSNYLENKRIGLNLRLKKMCEAKGCGFLEVDIDKEQMLDRKGLHLNYKGQERVARAIFKHWTSSLN